MRKLYVLIRFFREMVSDFKRSIKVYFHRAKWRNLNPHNRTIANSLFDCSIVSVGKGSYGHLNIHSYGSKDEKLTIGSFCSIAGGVHFILGGEHVYLRFSTYPFKANYGEYEIDAISKGEIKIENDVWIGYGSLILSGVHIGQGAVIAAGSIVCKDVPPYAVWIGTKVARCRFSEEICGRLKKVQWDLLDPEKVCRSGLLQEHVSESNIDFIMAEIADMSSK